MKLLFTLLFPFLVTTLFAEELAGPKITGKVVEQSTAKPVEYSNIVLLEKSDSSLVMGTVSGIDGVFLLSNVPIGSFILQVRFIGYADVSKDISVASNTDFIDLGIIEISPSSVTLENVVVQSQRTPISFQTDKKVIDVSQMQTTLSGNAAEVLENLPSVSVDIEGNVSLRGSQSITVLINGKVSPMDAQDILQQIPASSIDKIEIITNPSSKYDAQGTAGIINIILKESQQLGMSGILNANTGLNDKFGGDMLFDYKSKEWTSLIALDYNRRFSPGDSRSINRYTGTGTFQENTSSGSAKWGRISYGLRGNIEWLPSPSDVFSIGANTGSRDGQRTSTQIVNSLRTDNTGTSSNSYTDVGNRSRSGTFSRVILGHSKTFSTKDHSIISSLIYRQSNSDEFTNSSLYFGGLLSEGKRTTEAGPSSELEFQTDYTLPIGGENAIETGYQFQRELSEENTALYDYSMTAADFIRQPLFDRSTKYIEEEQAFYSQIKYEFGNLGLQTGIRAEYTDRKVEQIASSLKSSVNRWDVFPTFFSSYKFAEGHQVMASYTRRVERPGGWRLEPFETFIDANNVRIGNPELLNEYINAYEAGAQSYIGEISLSAELFYRNTINKIEEVNSIYGTNITRATPYNVGKDYSSGLEFIIMTDPFKFWNLNLSGALYNYRIEGVIDGSSFNRENFTNNFKVANNFKVTPSLQSQLNFNYSGPSVSSQGRTEANYSVDLAARYELMDKKLALTLQVRDVLGTATREFYSNGVGVYRYEYNQRESPMVMFNIRYNFNPTNKSKREGDPTRDGGDGMGEDF